MPREALLLTRAIRAGETDTDFVHNAYTARKLPPPAGLIVQPTEAANHCVQCRVQPEC